MSTDKKSDSSDKKPATNRFQPLPTGKKIFDIVPPGRAPASPSSRPVIVGQPPVADDQFVPVKRSPLEPPAPNPIPQTAPEAPTPEEVAPEPPKAPPVVMLSQFDARTDEQLQEIMTEDLTEPAPELPISEVQQPTELPQEPAEPPKKKKTIPVINGNQPPVQPEAEPSEVPKAEEKAEEQPDKLLKPLTDQDIAMHLGHDELVADTHFTHQEMVVSHHHHRLRFWQFLLIFGLIVVLALIALNFLLDAGVVTTDLAVPHTNFFQ